MQPPAERSFLARARKAIVFVAIVWGIAATFVAFEMVSLSGMDLVLSNPGAFGDLALSRTVTESTSCAVPSGDLQGQTSGVPNETEANVRSWSLGVILGRDAVVRQFAGSSTAFLDQLAAARNDIAAQLGVPPPDVFTPVQTANANIEFIAFVEEGPGSATAGSLAGSVSSRACELFKLGALWGYSEMVRPVLPGERAVFAMEIRHHATRAAVPEHLWSPMMERTPAGAAGDEIVAQMETLTGNLTAHLSSPQ